MKYNIIEIHGGGNLAVDGLPDTDWDDNPINYTGLPLVDKDSTDKQVLRALYDLYQCEDRLKDGDVFEYRGVRFECHGVHVIQSTT